MAEIVVKVGGGLLADVGALDDVLEEVAAAARRGVALLIVPGGGPFADAVRDLDRRVGLSGDAAHWMAILAMDQYAHLIVSRLPDATLVSTRDQVDRALAARGIPVLAPYLWLREADPLPHTWDATSDSIAAWVAGRLGASRLVLVKPSGVRMVHGRLPPGVVDPCFADILPPEVTVSVIGADRLDGLRLALGLGDGASSSGLYPLE